jgi:hypothetical protein
MGRIDHRGLLLSLARAARLPALALATMAGGPCCPEPEESCYTNSELVSLRDETVAAYEGAAGAPLTSNETAALMSAQSWDGLGCPDVTQFNAISPLGSDDQASAVKHEGDKCCYRIPQECGSGRPFLVGGSARVAPVRAGGGSPTHAALAHAWLADALAEHASVAAFARLTLQLMALGAPAELVQKSQEASLDELRHAEYCFQRASRYGGVRYAPAALAVTGALDDCSLAALIESNLLEGCIGETLASERLRRRAELTNDAELRASLLAISDDERRHAALAFEILAWCRDVDPVLTAAGIDRVLAATRIDPAPAGTDSDDVLFVNERATPALLLAHEREIWLDVIQPLLRASAEAAAA